MKICHVCKAECEDFAELCPVCGADLVETVEENAVNEAAEEIKTEANYQVSDNTAAVTSGETGGLKTFICYKYSPLPIKDLKMQKLIEVCKRLEQF